MTKIHAAILAAVLATVLATDAHAQVVPVPVSPAAPADSTDVVYVVKPGDTLWDIANRYLQNPFLWPDIFRRNTAVVQNPHWIYPGERIRIPVSSVRPEALADLGNSSTTASAPSVRVFGASTAFGTGGVARAGSTVFSAVSRDDRPAVRWGEIETAPFVDTIGGPPHRGTINSTAERLGIAAPLSDVRLQLYDKAYLTLPPSRTAVIGDRYLSYTLGPEVSEHGQAVIPTGVLQVDSIRPGYIRASVVQQFGPMELGQGIIPLELLPRPTFAEAIPVAAPETNRVIWVHNDPILPSLQHYVVLDPAGVPPIAIGDYFTLVDDPGVDGEGRIVPPEDIALAQVVRVSQFGATAVIVHHTQPVIKVGTRARRSARIP